MTEGNPLLALERHEPVATPPAIWIQGTPDPIHDYLDPESALGLNEPQRFAQRYSEAGGDIELCYIEQAERAGESLAPLVTFFRDRL